MRMSDGILSFLYAFIVRFLRFASHKPEKVGYLGSIRFSQELFLLWGLLTNIGERLGLYLGLSNTAS